MKRGLRPSIGLSGVRFARVKLPASLPRLVPVDDMLFPKLRLSDCHLFRVTRDADFEIKEDEAGDLLHTMQEHVRRMRFGLAVRLEVSATMPAETVNHLTTSLGLTSQDVYVIDGPLNIPDLMQLFDLHRPEGMA
jgi:polyphosphate kinase